jgi:hypothetical protein
VDEQRDEKADLLRWQYRLLPWAIGLLLALAVFFFASTWIQFDRLSAAMQARQPDAIEGTFAAYEKRGGAQDLPYLQWKTRTLLERKVVEHRYQQVNATLLLRTWTRHLGFLTGMILSFIGGIFILTKLSEGRSEVSGETGVVKASLATNSPGIVLTVVGGAIMIASLIVEYRFSTRDLPAYIASDGPAAAPPERPADWPEQLTEQQRQQEEDALYGNRSETAP